MLSNVLTASFYTHLLSCVMDQYRKTPRANFLDYDGGNFFVTICTKNRKHFFGEIYNGEMHLSAVGQYVESQLESASHYCSGIEVPLFVVMPNHIHAIVGVKSADMPLAYMEGNMQQRSPIPSFRANPTNNRHVPALSKYVSSLKGTVTKYAKSQGIEFGWQPRYHDHLIRLFKDGNKISEYIMNNVAKWQDDCFWTDGI